MCSCYIIPQMSGAGRLGTTRPRRSSHALVDALNNPTHEQQMRGHVNITGEPATTRPLSLGAH